MTTSNGCVSTSTTIGLDSSQPQLVLTVAVAAATSTSESSWAHETLAQPGPSFRSNAMTCSGKCIESAAMFEETVSSPKAG